MIQVTNPPSEIHISSGYEKVRFKIGLTTELHRYQEIVLSQQLRFTVAG